jgi:hypothetical protein
MRTLSLLICVFTFGCDNARPSDDDEASIQGGHVDKDDPAVGMIWFQGGGYCSGTLIAPDVVLTAAHCVQNPIDGFYTGAGEKTDPITVTPANGLTKHAVAAQLAHPSYSPWGGCPNQTFDVGLVRLQKPIKEVTPMVRATAAPPFSKACRIVGYGVHNQDGPSASYEQKRGANVWIKSSGPSYLEVLWKSGISDHGDSGGPLLCDEKIAGVTSCGTDGTYPDHRSTYYARVDDVGKWIDATVAKWK